MSSATDVSVDTSEKEEGLPLSDSLAKEPVDNGPKENIELVSEQSVEGSELDQGLEPDVSQDHLTDDVASPGLDRFDKEEDANIDLSKGSDASVDPFDSTSASPKLASREEVSFLEEASGAFTPPITSEECDYLMKRKQGDPEWVERDKFHRHFSEERIQSDKESLVDIKKGMRLFSKHVSQNMSPSQAALAKLSADSFTLEGKRFLARKMIELEQFGSAKRSQPVSSRSREAKPSKPQVDPVSAKIRAEAKESAPARDIQHKSEPAPITDDEFTLNRIREYGKGNDDASYQELLRARQAYMSGNVRSYVRSCRK